MWPIDRLKEQCKSIFAAVVVKTSVFGDVTPYSQLKVNQRFGGTSLWALFATCFHAGSSETSTDFQRIAWRYITEDRTLDLYKICSNNICSCAIWPSE
jgi:hypothetical protein